MKFDPIFLLIPALSLIWLAALLLGGANSSFDPAIISFLYSGDRPALAHAAIVVTQFGGWALLLPVTLLAAAVLLFRRRPRDALLLLLITHGGRLMVDAQKALTGRPRPEVPHLVPVDSLSFPSGHAANAMIAWLTLAIILRGGRPAIAAALMLALSVGLTRIMLGIHWPSDVLGGWAFGLLWVVLLTRLRSAL